MKLAYVAGPYRAANEWQLEQNIRSAEAVALELWQAGFAVICPHKNTAHFGGACPDAVWLDGHIEMLSRCDILVCAPNWGSSKGTLAEMEFASDNGIPCFFAVHAAKRWLAEKADEESK